MGSNGQGELIIHHNFGEVSVLLRPNRITLRVIELLMHWAPAKVWVIILMPFGAACRWVSFLPLQQKMFKQF